MPRQTRQWLCDYVDEESSGWSCDCKAQWHVLTGMRVCHRHKRLMVAQGWLIEDFIRKGTKMPVYPRRLRQRDGVA